MSPAFAGILGAAAMTVTFGAVQYASGSSLSGEPAMIATTMQSDAVNRAVKSDRAAGTVSHDSGSRTIALRLNGLNDTSVLVRIPATINSSVAADGASRRAVQTPSAARRASNFACEPVVSVLTDVAKSLAPGRCIS